MINDCILEMIQTVEHNKKIISSNKVSEVTSYKSKVKRHRGIPSDIDIKEPFFNSITDKGKLLSLEFENHKVRLTHKTLETRHLSLQELLDQARSITTIPTGYNSLLAIACVEMDEAWVCGNDKIVKRVDEQGSVQDTVTTRCKHYPEGITVNRRGELVYSDGLNRTVNVVRHGKIRTLITTPQGWHPDKLCCTESEDILVSMCKHRYGSSYTRHKIVRYQGESVTQEINRDEDGELIYALGSSDLYVVENNNGDVCASDGNANEVVVAKKSGRVRFRYDGTPARRKRPFYPVDIVTDVLDQIIVADNNNACLHILDQNGQFLRCVDSCGLDNPQGLSVDCEGRLWVGLEDSGEVKVIPYMK
jgi:DNA-binding beta-propeller fold protein YncE